MRLERGIYLVSWYKEAADVTTTWIEMLGSSGILEGGIRGFIHT